MTLKQYLLMMAAGTVLTLATALLMLFVIDPVQGGALSAGMLLLSLSLGTAGLLSVVGVLARVYVFRRPGLVTDHVRVSFRQGAVAATLLAVALTLSHLKLFAWWNMILALSIAAVIEYYFANGDAHKLPGSEPDLAG